MIEPSSEWQVVLSYSAASAQRLTQKLVLAAFGVRPHRVAPPWGGDDMAGEPVDLAGWHLAFAMSYKDLNDQIAGQIQALRTNSPTVYPVQISLDQSTGGSNPYQVTLTGNPMPWRLIEGGRQEAAKIGIEIDNVSASIVHSGVTTTFTGAVSVSINAELTVDTGTNKIRIVKPLSAGGSPYDFGGFSDLSPTPSNFDGALIKDALQSWLDSLWDLFGQELMTVDPTISLPGDWAWLAPQNSRAIVSEVGMTVDEHQFIVVSMTGSAPAPSAVTLAGSLIPPGSKMGLAMAPSPFLENVIKKGMPLTFLKTPSDQFTVTGNELSANGDITVSQFQIDDTHTVDATFSGAKFSIQDDQLVFDTHIAFPYQEAGTHAVDVNLDFALSYTLSLSRESITVPDSSAPGGTKTIPDYPLIQSDPGKFNIKNLYAEATETFDILMWAVSFGASLLVTIAAAGVGIYRGRQAWQNAQAGPGNNAVQMNNVGGGVAAGNAAQGAAAAQQAGGAAAGGPAPPVMWGALPRATVLSLIGISTSWLVTTLLATVPFWIYLTQSKDAKDLVDKSMDDAISNLLKTYRLPVAAAEDMKVTSIGLNNSLLIGADPL